MADGPSTQASPSSTLMSALSPRRRPASKSPQATWHLTLACLLLAERAAQRSGYPEVGSRIAALGLSSACTTRPSMPGGTAACWRCASCKALAHYADGDRPEALAALSRALVEGPEPDSYVRLYRDEGAPMLALLRDAAARPP